MQLTLGFEDDLSPLPDRAKALGAYYTDTQVAEFLAWWAIRSGNDTVMDPCFGGGVFLRAACRRIHKFGAQPKESVFGVELDADVFTRIAGKLTEEYALNRRHLICDVFFNVEPKSGQLVDAIIGNPPFIRYQRFSADSRNHADVGIGYVMGANDFFHLTPEEIRKRRIPMEFLKPAVRRGRALSCDDAFSTKNRRPDCRSLGTVDRHNYRTRAHRDRLFRHDSSNL